MAKILAIIEIETDQGVTAESIAEIIKKQGINISSTYGKQDNAFRDDEKLLSVKDIADYLGVGETRAYQLVREKNFPSFQEGRRWLTPKNLFMEYIYKKTEPQINKLNSRK